MERRAALAHELAHICRHDFLTGLVAQVSLSLHFYNPLAHWLTARLRLEQELAADAWGALLSGGNQSYVTTLAQMALRRDGRAPSWPARAFLPSRATFVRRIEMLRNARRVRHAPLPRVVRLLTIGVLCSLGLLVTAVRTPAGVPSVQAGEQVAGASETSSAPIVQSGIRARRCEDARCRAAPGSARAPRISAACGIDEARSGVQGPVAVSTRRDRASRRILGRAA